MPNDPRIWVIVPEQTPLLDAIPKRRYFNQYMCLVEGGTMCAGCGKGTDYKGELFIGCCPETFDTFDEAVEDAKKTVEISTDPNGEENVEYMGTFEVDL